ncbi:sensor domain-containing diguanylate cyclase [Massilia soli]|uniref:PAS domain S-box protein n=1 Tax=Massilia soli TaxID=2792854 RepID=A0ABS7SUH5_9BURK|nr:PAS domain S-box protein [Massilia soli]MBZ2209608.1 PAS domain S-box protein [Massilia soli]
MTSEGMQEALRLQALSALGILDTPPEDRFDRFARLAAAAFSVPIALVSLVDEGRQWFKACVGLSVTETPRDVAFCSHAIAASGVMVVPNALLDPRFSANPLVTGSPHIRFYAGQRIHTSDGIPIGTLCIIDTVPRVFGPESARMLVDLALLVEDEINRDALVTAREAAERALSEANSVLERRIAERTQALEDKNEALTREIRQRNSLEQTLRKSNDRIGTIIATSFSAFISTDAAGVVLEWNASAERIFGWPAGEVVGLSIGDLIVPERMRAAHNAGMARFREQGGSSVMNRALQMPAVTKSGTEIVVEMTISAFEVDGELFFGSFLHDISERLRVERALHQKQEMLDAVLETVDVAVIACDGDGALTLFNRAAREFHGQSIDGGDQRGWAERYDLFQADGETRLDAQDIPLVRALSGEQVKDAALIIAPAGLRRRTVLASGRLLVGAGGERMGAVVAMKDITELNEWQQRLRQNEQRLRAITENVPALIGQVDGQERFVFLNSQALDYYGQTAQRLMGQPVKKIYSEQEYARLSPHIRAAMSGERVTFESEFILKGKRRFFHACYVPNKDHRGQPDGFYAMAFDITARRESEIAQSQAEEWLRTITDNVPALISYLDAEGRFRFANAMHREWKGTDSDAMIGCTMAEVYGEDYVQARLAALAQCQAGTSATLELPHVHGERVRMLRSTYIPHLRDGSVVGTYVLSSDTTAAHEDSSRLRDLANSDALTGLPNRRCYEQALAAAVSRSGRTRGLALMYLDIDHFKSINDSFGHAAGDEVLKELGRRIQGILRSSDVLSRLAGDEFTVLLENVDSLQVAERVAGKIIAALEPDFTIGSESVHVSASIGVAFTHDEVGFDQIGSAADEALYQAKRAGRAGYRGITVNGARSVVDWPAQA